MDLSTILTPQELDAFIREHYPHHPSRVLAAALGLTPRQVYARAYALGLRKDPGYRAQQLEAIAQRLAESGKAHRFKPGQQAHNKGKRMPAEVYAKARATMFPKGNKPHNTKHDGHISIRRDKTGREYAWVRVHQGEYRMLHRVVWEENNGPIPNNMVVAFKSANTMDCTLENLELISKAHNMRRNSMLRYPPDMVQAIRLKGALKRRIRKLDERW